MFLPLVLLLSVAPSARQDPPIRISLNSDGRYLTGDRARVRVRASEDGYLVVLRTDVNGWVRVLFPADPRDDNFVHAGRDLDIRGRDGREAFQAGLSEGSGTILAARASESFHFDRLIRDNHWDYRALDSLRAAPGTDAEGTLLAIAQQMAGDVHFDYDAATYSVADRDGYASAGAYSGGYEPGYGYAPRPYLYDPYYYYDPFFYSAYFYAPWYFQAYCFGCFPRFYGLTTFRGVNGRRPFGPTYRPRSAVVGAGFGTGVRARPAAPARSPGFSPAPRSASGRRYTSTPSPSRSQTYGAPAASRARSYGGAPSYGGRSGGGGGGGRRR